MRRRNDSATAAPEHGAPPGRTQRGIQSVEVGGRLLRALADARAPLGATDLAASGDIPSSQAHAYLVSLTRLGLIKRDALSGRYEPGPLALRLGLLHLAQQPALREAVPRAAALAHSLNCSVALCIAGPQGPTIVRYEHASLPLHVNLHVGTVMSLRATSTGRVFCAHLAPDALDDILARQTAQPVWRGTRGAAGASAAPPENPAPPAPDAAFLETLEAIRTRGYELGIDAPSPGVSSVCVPVLGPQRELGLSLTAIGASGALDVRPNGAVVRALRDAAAEIAAAAFHTTPTCPE
ncbi:IclR family transcriptional regulator [Paraburkholderia unamae]|uniref:IclR family transcriptional regulator n=1 Tax=Paraburkholderia unamae TaxID=219649 RepID=A0ABX5KJN8_9BURK|nr:helix-turn-helix domain-containing protein [Paraburkholderia unamae]PVX78918.1 IclR family transcriptional regulator [Paraburkholderia unamae]